MTWADGLRAWVNYTLNYILGAKSLAYYACKA